MSVSGSIRNKNKVKFNEVVEYRNNGLSYSEIRNKTGLAKSTINNWLRYSGLTLTADHLSIQKRKRLENWKSGVEAAKIIRNERYNKYIGEFLHKVESSMEDPLLIAGSIAYQAEGSKSNSCTFANSDYRLIKLFTNFMEQYFDVNKVENLRYRLYIHEVRKNDLERITNFWADKLGILNKEFRISWKTNIIKRKRNNTDYVGLIGVVVVGKKLILKKILALSGIIVEKYCGVS